MKIVLERKNVQNSNEIFLCKNILMVKVFKNGFFLGLKLISPIMTQDLFYGFG